MSNEKRSKRGSAVGSVRVIHLMLEYSAKGFYVEVARAKANHEGCDLVVFSSEVGRQVVEVIESTNYARADEVIDPTKFARYVRQLDFYDFMSPRPKKTLVASYLENLTDPQQSTLKEHNIGVRVMGFQDLLVCERCGKVIDVTRKSLELCEECGGD